MNLNSSKLPENGTLIGADFSAHQSKSGKSASHPRNPRSILKNQLAAPLLLGLGVILAACAPAPALPPAAVTVVDTPAPIAEAAEPSAPAVQPIQVTYTTPSQQEGPYYPVAKPADRDNDLVTLAGASALPAGDVVRFSGKIYDAGGMPVAGAVVEIWQTDASGVYDHPGDPGTDSRDRNFQFYGEAITGPDGGYSFRTLLPGEYEPRPRHIHVKIKLDGQELITTQFYFGDDTASPLNIDLTPSTDSDGSPILTGMRDVVLPMTLSTP